MSTHLLYHSRFQSVFEGRILPELNLVWIFPSFFKTTLIIQLLHLLYNYYTYFALGKGIDVCLLLFLIISDGCFTLI